MRRTLVLLALAGTLALQAAHAQTFDDAMGDFGRALVRLHKEGRLDTDKANAFREQLVRILDAWEPRAAAEAGYKRRLRELEQRAVKLSCTSGDRRMDAPPFDFGAERKPLDAERDSELSKFRPEADAALKRLDELLDDLPKGHARDTLRPRLVALRKSLE